MTVMPGALPAPAPSPASAADGTTARTTGGGFLELLLAALPATDTGGGSVPGGADGETSDGTGTLPETAAPSQAEPAEETESQVSAAVALPVPLAVLAQQPPAVVEAVRLADAPPVGDASFEVTGGTTTVDAPETSSSDLPTSTAQAVRGTEEGPSATPAPGPATSTPEAGVLAETPGQTRVAAGPAGEGRAIADPVALAEGRAVQDGEATPSTTTTADDGNAAQRGGATAPLPSPAAPTASQGGIDVSALTQVTGPGTAAPVGLSVGPSAAQATAEAAPAPVAQQVLPEVSRLATRGDGTHRLTMTLSPEALGDVRVTLTVNDGQVTVHFEAGDEARRALLESAPELRRLLELTGATESRVTVRDSAGPGATAHQSSTGHSAHGQTGSGDPDPSTGGQDPTARQGSQDQHAGTRDGQNATDGAHRGAGETRRPLDPVASTRPAGLDVTV